MNKIEKSLCFNPRARAGRDSGLAVKYEIVLSFNPRARAGRDRADLSSIRGRTCFNPRARAGRDTKGDRSLKINPEFQSTRPRGARRSSMRIKSSMVVSIHAPARGATCHGFVFDGRVRVSIHAPARGATNMIKSREKEDKFQSTRPRGARPQPAGRDRRNDSFNPRARAGRDVTSKDVLAFGTFQSTRPRGARPGVEWFFPIWNCFNPRARAGRDSRQLGLRWRCSCFNPRARAGRDDQHTISYRIPKVSIHAPARGATALIEQVYRWAVFQSTRPRGARHSGEDTYYGSCKFQSTRPRGARHHG